MLLPVEPEVVPLLVPEGSVVPGVMNTYLSYKQKRQEKMFIKFMEEIKSKV